jgi:hypothetical protein
MQQFLAAQTQLLQNLTATVQNLQAQQNQPAPPPPPLPQPRDKHKEFMSHNPPTYSHSSDPLDADDWLKTVTKKLEIVQCTDREMVLYAAGRLTGQAADWWDAYSAAHPNRNNITWQEFRDNFRTYHIPSGVIKLKQKEFLALKQGNMSVTEYLDKFTHLSRYAPDEVNTDPKRRERFLDGLVGPLNYQLQSHTFPNFQMLLNKAIGLENKRMEFGEQKRKFKSHGQSRNTRPRFNSSQDSQFYSGGSSGNYTQNLQHSTQQPQHSSHQTPHAPSHHQDHSEVPVRSNSPVRPNGCFNCGELGHYANICPKRNMQTPQKDIGQRSGQLLSQARIGNSTYRGNRGQRNYTPMSSMKTHLLISSPNGEMKSTYVCPRVNLKIRGIDFQADLVVLKSSGIDVILGMDWLGKCDGIILRAKKSVLLTSPQGDKIEVSATTSSKKEREVNQDEGKKEKKQSLLEELSKQNELKEEFL